MTDKNDRGTPENLFAKLHAEFGFTLDVAATSANAKCQRYYTKADDGLAQSWEGERVWCNPPYDVLHPWIEKAWKSKAQLVAMLIPANRTEQPFWQELIEPHRDRGGALSVRFIAKRRAFVHPETGPMGQAPFGLVLLVWNSVS
jgi:phage N-6-adenine-methyltransferase